MSHPGPSLAVPTLQTVEDLSIWGLQEWEQFKALCVFLRGERCSLCVAWELMFLCKENSGCLSATATSPCRSQAHPPQAWLGERPECCILDLMYLHRWYLAQFPAHQLRCRFIARVWTHSLLWSIWHCQICPSLCPTALTEQPQWYLSAGYSSSASSQVGFARDLHL